MSRYCETGELFGLLPSDLTDAQLAKIQTSKLIEFLELDSRTEALLAARMVLDVEAKELSNYSSLKDEWNTYSLLRQAYNDLLTVTNSFEDKCNRCSYYCYRSQYLFWPALNDDRKLYEIQLFLEQKESVVNSENVDYGWLNAMDPELSKKVMRHVVATESSYSKRGTLQIIMNANEEMLKEMKPNIFKLDKDYQLKMLSNHNTPEAWLDGLLRIYAKRVSYNVPEVNRPLSSHVLNKLPPITRLEVIERLVYKNSGPQLEKALPDIKTGDDFNVLLFGALVRHSARVFEVVKRYNAKIGKVQET